MIEFREITKSFQTDFWAKKFKALDCVSFSIEEGTLVGFLGANGAGKTTSIKIMMDFIRPDVGSIHFSSALGKTKKEILSNIGFVPERPYFYPYLTGREFLEYLASLNDVPRVTRKLAIKKWSDVFSINYALDRKIRGYSKGMLQRLGFVSALVHDPKLIVLDEPLSGLDPLGRKEIKDALVELNRMGKTIFFSSHIVSDVEEICERVVVLQHGKNLYQGSVDKLILENISSDYFLRVKLDDCAIAQELLGEFKYDILDSSVFNIQCNKNERDQLLSKVLTCGGEVLSVAPGRPTLEQVIYNIKK
ncbi:MAG: ABC transporter ATP-binding protein [Bacteriovoracaceae bacterium]|nr:ABC transporter ATP-binding protein [Bacteriovoracaceae bacterium]